ncbi:hypothetical protein L208DRAFT_1230511, partial [Tricholoma matsutake]
YRAAHKKYSEAIKEDSTNAVLWANRAASGLGMKEYLDAGRATQLGPNYAKAWGRLATAGMVTIPFTILNRSARRDIHRIS